MYLAEADRSTPGFMRAPAEMPYLFALESAINELAEEAGIDPVEFRRRNDVQVIPVDGRRFSSRSLIACLDAGAAAFGWAKRDPRPGATRDGEWLVGQGMAAACSPTKNSVAAIEVGVAANGQVTVRIGAHEIGTGAFGVAAIIAAQEPLSRPREGVRVPADRPRDKCCAMRTIRRSTNEVRARPSWKSALTA